MMLRGLLNAGGEELLRSYRKPPALSGAAKREADALVAAFASWFDSYSDGWADCQHISTVVGAELEKRGHSVVVIGGTAFASDSQDDGIHYWLHVDGRFYDPKMVLLRQEDADFKYTKHSGEWRWTVDEALNNSVEKCPIFANGKFEP